MSQSQASRFSRGGFSPVVDSGKAATASDWEREREQKKRDLELKRQARKNASPPPLIPVPEGFVRLRPATAWNAGNAWTYLAFWENELGDKFRITIKRHAKDDMSEARINWFNKASGWVEVAYLHWLNMSSVDIGGEATPEEILEDGSVNLLRDEAELLELTSLILDC